MTMGSESMIYALWHGGNGYTHGDIVGDLETFGGLAAARDALRERLERGDTWKMRFEYVNRDAGDVYTPCVSDDCGMWVWFAADVIEGVTYVPEYPDRVLSIGPRGGVRMERA